MGLDLNSLASNTATVEFEVMGQTGHLTYRPSVVTTERVEGIDQRAKADSPEGLYSFFLDVIVDWDVMTGSRKVPLTAKGIGSLPVVLHRAMFLAILRDAGQGGQGNSSSGISRPQDRKAKSPRGTRSSKRPSTSV
jgi:hypothetical protein